MKSKKTELEQIEEKREAILAQGRKFKYPLQYAKHRLVVITVIIAVLAVVAALVTGWAVLYKVQDTGDMMYRITQVLPLPVAKVEGETVKYSDYLTVLKSSLRTVEQQNGKLGDDAEADSVRQQYKRAALDNVEEYAYAEKKAGELGISVSQEEVDKAFEDHRKVGGVERSEESFLKILEDNFGMTKKEYERMLYISLVKSKVSEKIDTEAQEIAQEVARGLQESGGDMRNVADSLGEVVEYEETGGLVDAYNIDGGRAMVAGGLAEGQISEAFLSNNGDGYYFVKLLGKTETQVNYASIKIKFKKFAEEMKKLKDEGKIKELIEIKALE